MAERREAIDEAREISESTVPAESPDERSTPYYLRGITLALVDIAESLRILAAKQ